MPDLIAPHGGVSEPVCRTVPADAIPEFLAHAKTLTQVPVSDADLSDRVSLGDGGLSPLEGPLDAAAYDRVLDESVIERDGRLYAWTIPWRCRLPAAWPKQLGPGKEVALVNSAGEIVGHTSDHSVFPLGQDEVSQVGLPHRIAPTIPAATWCSKGMPTSRTCWADRFRVLPQPKDPRFGKLRAHAARSPPPAGKQKAGSGWSPFQTRNPLHRPMNMP